MNLSYHGKRLFLDMLSKYNGFNNGDLSFTWRQAKIHGWKSKQTHEKAIKELLKHKILIKTRQGGKNKCCLYALTLYAIDDVKGKFDHGIKATTTPTGGWSTAISPAFL